MTWRSSASTLRTPSLALAYSGAEFCCAALSHNSHFRKSQTTLNSYLLITRAYSVAEFCCCILSHSYQLTDHSKFMSVHNRCHKIHNDPMVNQHRTRPYAKCCFDTNKIYSNADLYKFIQILIKESVPDWPRKIGF